MSVPADLRYTPEHEWVSIDGTTASIGITEYAAQQLGDVVYISLPTAGARLALAAPHEEYHGHADQDGCGGGARYQRVDLASPLAELLHRPLRVLRRAYPVGDGVDGARQLRTGAVDVRYQRVLVDGLG